MSILEAQQRREDEEANQFALALLMPEKFVRQEVKKLGLFDLEDNKKLKQLADRFKVSIPVITFRLGQLSMMKGPKHARR